MERNVLQQKCLPHKFDIAAFDLDPLAKAEDRYLCLKCLVIQSPFRQIEIIQDALQKFREMTTFEFNNKKNQMKLNLEKLQNAKNQLKGFLDFFNNITNESIKTLNFRIQEKQNELNSLIDPQQEIMSEQDLLDLSNYVNFGIYKNLNQKNPKNEELLDSIKLYFEKINEQLQQISNSLDSIFTQNIMEDQEQQNLSNQSQLDQQKYLNLRHLCQNHKSEITMICLEPIQIKQRLFCQFCIQEQKQNKLTSLYEVNKLWQTHLQNLYKNYNNFYNLRWNNQNKIEEIIVQYQQLNSQFINQLNKFIINQNNKLVKERNDLKISNMNKQLYQMELNEVLQVVETLSKQDQMQEVLQKRLQIENEDKQQKDQIQEILNQSIKKLVEFQTFQNQTNISKIDFKFSHTLRHFSTQLSEQNKKVSTINNKFIYAAILCDQKIPQDGSFTIDFKINKLYQIMIGACQSKVIKQDYNFNNKNSVVHGFYVLNDEGRIFSHQDLSINGEQFGFKFQEGDIINVEVNQITNQIIWRNKFIGLQYVLEFQPCDDIYFCCVMYQYNETINEVEII